MSDDVVMVERSEKAAAPVPAEGWFKQLADYAPPTRGEIVDGTVVANTPNEIRVDIGGKSEGVIDGRELERMPDAMLDELAVGGQVKVYVVNPLDRDGKTVVSLRRAEEELDWQRAEELLESRDIVASEITGYNKGGLLIQMGQLKGFVPGSQIDPLRTGIGQGSTPEDRWLGLVGEPIQARVIEVDRDRNRLILSERAAMAEVREKQKSQLMDELQEGDVRAGRVVNLARFGAFVDIGGADGLVHLSELSWKRVAHPSEVVSVGDAIEVYVLNVDRERRRIGLSLKRLQPDPWWRVEEHCQVGELVEGTVTKLTKFGAFAAVEGLDGIEGLIHISELSDDHVEHPKEAVNEGQRVTLRVISVDVFRRRLGLSIRRVSSDEYLDTDWPERSDGGEDSPS
jgi:small subunit ribosomal protein S1